MDDERDQLRTKSADASANILKFTIGQLEIIGDKIAEKMKYNDIDGVEAVRFYLMEKHHWIPAVVREMSHEDLVWAVGQDDVGK